MTEQQPRTRHVAPGDGTDDEEPLGELGFDDWFAIPLFDTDEEERLEELATSGRGPVRLAASAALGVGARFSAVRHRRSTGPVAAPEPVPRPSSGPHAGRLARAIDRWAEAEVAAQARLEKVLLPRRWQT